MVKPLGRHVQ